jgi:hypothetical protein
MLPAGDQWANDHAGPLVIWALLSLLLLICVDADWVEMWTWPHISSLKRKLSFAYCSYVVLSEIAIVAGMIAIGVANHPETPFWVWMLSD